MEFLPRIKQSCNAVVNITTGGGHGMTLEERLAGAMRTKPEMSSLNMGSMNFGLYRCSTATRSSSTTGSAGTWRTAGTSSSGTRSRTSNTSCAISAKRTAPASNSNATTSGHLYNLAHFLDRGLVRPPLFVQTIFGILGGIGADQENLVHMKRIADKLFGDDYYWSVLAAGRHQLGFVTMSAIMGGNVRVGLEDSLYAGKGRLARSNAEQVRTRALDPREPLPRNREP